MSEVLEYSLYLMMLYENLVSTKRCHPQESLIRTLAHHRDLTWLRRRRGLAGIGTGIGIPSTV